MTDPTNLDAMLDAAFNTAERDVDEAGFPADVARRVRRRTRGRRAALAASALLGLAIAAPHVAASAAVVSDRLQGSALTLASVAAWLVAAAAILAALDAALPSKWNGTRA